MQSDKLIRALILVLTVVGLGTLFGAPAWMGPEWGNNQQVIKAPLTTSATTYAINKPVGGQQTLTGMTRVATTAGSPGTGGNILMASLTFQDAIGTVPFDVYFYDSLPTAANCADNGTFAVATADRDKVIGIAHLTDINPSNTAVIVQNQERPLPYTLNNTTTAYACVVSRAAFTGAVTGTANATLRVNLLRQ